MKIIRIQLQNYKNYEIHRILYRIIKIIICLSITLQNYENHEVHKIPCQNHENYENIIILVRNMKIMKFI